MLSRKVWILVAILAVGSVSGFKEGNVDTLIKVLPLVQPAVRVLWEAFANQTINKKELKTAEEILDEQPLDYWNEKTYVDTSQDIDISQLPRTVEGLKRKYSLGYEMDQFKDMLKMKAHSQHFERINFAKDFKMKYGFVAMTRDGDKFSYAVALYDVEFKLKEKDVTRWYCIWCRATYEPVALPVKSMKIIKNSYLPKLAFESFENKGIAGRIRVIDDAREEEIRFRVEL